MHSSRPRHFYISYGSFVFNFRLNRWEAGDEIRDISKGLLEKWFKHAVKEANNAIPKIVDRFVPYAETLSGSEEERVDDLVLLKQKDPVAPSPKNAEKNSKKKQKNTAALLAAASSTTPGKKDTSTSAVSTTKSISKTTILCKSIALVLIANVVRGKCFSYRESSITNSTSPLAKICDAIYTSAVGCFCNA